MRYTTVIAFLLMACVASSPAFAQKNEKDSTNFSQWNLRFNPIFIVEPLGGINLGIETNIDKKKKLYLVSEFGIIFINNMRERRDINEDANPVKLNGFKTTQELKYVVLQNKGRQSGAIAIESNFLKGTQKNSGWFGMGNDNGNTSYLFFKYQNFTEQVTEISGAIKYSQKAYFGSSTFHHLEVFLGLGMINRKIENKNAEGKLVQPDHETLYSNERTELLPYLSAGLRLGINLKK